MKFFRQMMQSGRINAYNLHFLQALVRRIGRNDLYDDVREFCLRCQQQPIHFFSPSDEPGISCNTFLMKHPILSLSKQGCVKHFCLNVFTVAVTSATCSSLNNTGFGHHNDIMSCISPFQPGAYLLQQSLWGVTSQPDIFENNLPPTSRIIYVVQTWYMPF